MLDYRPVFLVIGVLLCILAAAMSIPALVDYAADNADWQAFAAAAFATSLVGGGLVLTNRVEGRQNLSLKQAFVLTSLAWVVLVVFAALPFLFSDWHIGFTDAFFEAMAGITTTGATVLTGLDHLPPGLLLWRAILQWLGGIGIIVMAMAVLPMLKIGGMQLFRTESSDKSEKILPKATQVATAIFLTYTAFTVLVCFALWWAGMSFFDAVCHAMTTIATAGFSTHDASIGYFDDLTIEVIITLGMIVSGIPIVMYIQALRGKPEALYKDSQVRWYLSILACGILMATMWLVFVNDHSLGEALRKASFNVTSIMTTTGYATDDYYLWGSFAVLLFFMLGVIGGCPGSTTGGIKVFRYQVLYKTARAQINQLSQPHGVFRPLYNRKPIPEQVMSSVLSFFILFAFCFTVLALALSLTGLDYITSMSGAASMLANVGPGLGHVIGPGGNYGTLPDVAKWLLTLGMLMGRLEIFTVLVLFSPYFWRN